jgi:hypothetical protein
MAMFEIDAPLTEAFEYTRGVVGSAIACLALLACLVIADKLFWTEQAASNQTRYGHHHRNTSG